MEAAKVSLFAVSIGLGLLFSYLCYRMVQEVNLQVPQSKRVSPFRGPFVIFVIHRRVYLESWLRLMAILCLVVTFILFTLSADAVL